MCHLLPFTVWHSIHMEFPITEMWLLAPFLCREKKHGTIRFITCSKTAQTPRAELIYHTVIRVWSVTLPVVLLWAARERTGKSAPTHDNLPAFLKAGTFRLQSTFPVSEWQHVCMAQRNFVRDTFGRNMQDAWNDLQSHWPIALNVRMVSTLHPMKILSSFQNNPRTFRTNLNKMFQGSSWVLVIKEWR